MRCVWATGQRAPGARARSWVLAQARREERGELLQRRGRDGVAAAEGREIDLEAGAVDAESAEGERLHEDRGE